MACSLQFVIVRRSHFRFVDAGDRFPPRNHLSPVMRNSFHPFSSPLKKDVFFKNKKQKNRRDRSYKMGNHLKHGWKCWACCSFRGNFNCCFCQDVAAAEQEQLLNSAITHDKWAALLVSGLLDYNAPLQSSESSNTRLKFHLQLSILFQAVTKYHIILALKSNFVRWYLDEKITIFWNMENHLECY